MAYEVYKVVAGDNLTKIAKAYNTTVAELVKVNGIANPNLIFVGQEIKIPVPDAAPAVATAAAPQTTTYKIQPGDNLTKIAKEFGTTVEALVRLNNIANPNLIYAGAELIVPAGAAQVQAAAAAKEAAEKAAAEAKAAEEKAKAEAQEKAIAQAKAVAAAKAAAAEYAKKQEQEAAAKSAAAAADFAKKQETLASAKVEEAKQEEAKTEKKGFLSGLFGKK